MKKILTVFLSLCLLASLATCFAFSAQAEESEDLVITVGQTFEWNSQAGSTDKETAWRASGGKSPDGLWTYFVYSTVKKIYQPTVYAAVASGYAWNSNPTGSTVGSARARAYGGEFHPADAADIVKAFTCPSGGVIDIDTTIARLYDIPEGTGPNGTSFAIYLDDQLIYPTSGEALTLSNTSSMTIPVTDIEVSKNQCIYFHVGALGNCGADPVSMSNTITYRKINDAEVDVTTHTGIVVPTITATYDVPTLNNDDGNVVNKGANDGLSAGAIVGIVIGGIAVVGIAAAAVILIKKKKEQ